MSETLDTTAIPETDHTIAEDDLDLDAWLDSGTLARRSVEIAARPDLIAQYEDLERQLRRLEREGQLSGGESSMGEASSEDAILEQIQALYEQWRASMTTWTVRALTEDEIAEIRDAHPVPERPKILMLPRPTKTVAQINAYDQAAEEYAEALAPVTDEQNIAMIATAVTEIRSPKGSKSSVTADQVRRLLNGPHGRKQAAKLLNAINDATTGEAEVPRPTWPGRSATARG